MKTTAALVAGLLLTVLLSSGCWNNSPSRVDQVSVQDDMLPPPKSNGQLDAAGVEALRRENFQLRQRNNQLERDLRQADKNILDLNAALGRTKKNVP